MNRKIAETIEPIVGFVGQDLTAGAKTTAYVDVSGAGRIGVNVSSNDTAAGQGVSVQFKQATDSSGTGAKNLGDAIALTGASSGKLSLIAERLAEGLDAGFTHIAAEVTETDSPAALSSVNATVILADYRYNPS